MKKNFRTTPYDTLEFRALDYLRKQLNDENLIDDDPIGRLIEEYEKVRAKCFLLEVKFDKIMAYLNGDKNEW
jgi:hypothetical protein